jgi:hypothetical protein
MQPFFLPTALTDSRSHRSSHSLESTANGPAPLQVARNRDATGSTSRPNAASMSLVSLAIADAPTLYDQRSCSNNPGVHQATGSPKATLLSTSTSPHGNSVASTNPQVVSTRKGLSRRPCSPQLLGNQALVQGVTTASTTTITR